jgi:hypothetical protein
MWMDYLERLKRKLPLNVLKELEVETDSSLKFVLPKEGDNILFRLEEKVDYSDFYFEVKSFEIIRGKKGFKCLIMPQSTTMPTAGGSFITVGDLGKKIKAWSNLVSQYHTTNTPFDDPAYKAQYEFYSGVVQFVGDNKETPFVGNPLVYLVSHTERLRDYVLNLEGYDKEDSEPFLKELREFKKEVASRPKQEIFEQLLRIWAKGTTKFPELVTFLKKEFSSWSVTKLFDGTFEFLSGLIS